MSADSIAEARNELLARLSPLLVPPDSVHKKYKVIHDPIWGSCRFEPWEATLIDMPLFQRLRGLKQTGLAYQTYPAAEHSRFHHMLGVMTAASRILTSIKDRINSDGIAPRAAGNRKDVDWIRDDFDRTHTKLRLAALVHDLGHSLFSHTSERVYRMLQPFPELVESLKHETSKKPGAAEVVVYLLVTSERWQRIANEILEHGSANPLEPREWQQVAQWILGYEPDLRKRFLAEIISGPLDADKLDYIARDAYFAGIPVGHDYERYVSLVCVDFQGGWWRLTLPQKGINALEQLIMARLALTSYLYHHQKVRSSEAWFERMLAREYLGAESFWGSDSIWDLFTMEDAELYAKARADVSSDAFRLMYRQLPVRYLEFREQDVLNKDSAAAGYGFARLLGWTNSGDWEDYQTLLSVEESIAKRLGLSSMNAIIIDIPRTPQYAELESLELPGRSVDGSMLAEDALMYKDWIDAYKAHRACIRVFGPRGIDKQRFFREAKSAFSCLGIELADSNLVNR
jgi:HD superfamily phosphohydrolase